MQNGNKQKQDYDKTNVNHEINFYSVSIVLKNYYHYYIKELFIIVRHAHENANYNSQKVAKKSHVIMNAVESQKKVFKKKVSQRLIQKIKILHLATEFTIQIFGKSFSKVSIVKPVEKLDW